MLQALKNRKTTGDLSAFMSPTVLKACQQEQKENREALKNSIATFKADSLIFSVARPKKSHIHFCRQTDYSNIFFDNKQGGYLLASGNE